MNVKRHTRGLKGSVAHVAPDKGGNKGGGKQIKPATVPAVSAEVVSLRQAFAAAHGRETTLSDAVIQKLWDDASDGIGPDEMLAAEQPAQTEMVDDTEAAIKAKSIGVTNPDAQAVAKTLAASPAVLSAVHTFIEVRSAGVRVVAEMAYALYHAWGGSHEAVRDYLSPRPIPGSRHIEGKVGAVMMGTGDNKREVPSQAPADQMKAGELTYWGEVADAISPDAQEALGKLAELSKWNTSDAPAWVKDLDEHDKDGAKTFWQSRRSNAGRILRDGVNFLRRMCIEVPQDTLLKAVFRTKLLPGGGEALREHTSLFVNVRLTLPNGDQHNKPFSTASFMAVDMDKVKTFTTAADQWRNFAVDRTPRPEGNAGTERIITVQTIGDAVQALEEFNGFLHSDTGKAELIMALNKAGSDAWVKDVVQLSDVLNSIRERSDFKARFLAITAQGDAPSKTGTTG